MCATATTTTLCILPRPVAVATEPQKKEARAEPEVGAEEASAATRKTEEEAGGRGRLCELRVLVSKKPLRRRRRGFTEVPISPGGSLSITVLCTHTRRTQRNKSTRIQLGTQVYQE